MTPAEPSVLRRMRLVGVGVVTAALMATGCGSADPDPDPSNPDPTATVEPDPTQDPADDTVPGVYPDQILFGQSAAFTGPAQELGINMRRGILAAFEEANRQGGVHGRILKLTSRDDFYEPEAAITNTQILIDFDRVFALIGAVGTPTSRSATPIAAEFGVPYVAPFTGAGFLRDDDWDNIVNLRASYAQETEEMVERLTTDLGITRIAIMFQDDSFGRAGRTGALAALERRGMAPVATGVYPRNTTAVKSALLDLRRGAPEAVILVGAYQPVAALIDWARHVGFDPVFMTISFVGSNALADELGAEGEGVYVTQVVPFPLDTSIPVVASYTAALAEYNPEVEPGFVSLEGYLAGRLAIAGLRECGPEPTRDCFLEHLLGGGVIDIGGFTFDFGDEADRTVDNQGSDAVFLTVIDADGRYRPATSLQDTGS
ncbi:ABC transporter substrate-binding protein [Candidatus Poriferisocius sp.]|uniref:ABC transporter substrate-binding protein n=1 Tax=Candidatus Poriferisocius sp. TaxID=3101276 RepID=UPI003B5BEB3D